MFEKILARQKELETAIKAETDHDTKLCLMVRWQEVCNILNLLGYEEPEESDELLDSLFAKCDN